MRVKIKKLLRETKFDQKISSILSKYNIDKGKDLGQGKYGLVIAGISENYGPVAIKILKSSNPNTKREVENYRMVNEARSKSPYIKKHFPEVYHIDESSDSDYTLIIMEILSQGEADQYETISMIFGGMNTALRPTEDEKEIEGFVRTRENRYYIMFKNKSSQDSIVEEFEDNFPKQIHFLNTTIKKFFSYIDAHVSNKAYSQKKLQLLNILPVSDRAKTYLNNWMTGKPKAMFESAPWMMTFIIEQLDTLEQHPNKMLFAQHHEDLILFWLEWFRKNSPVGLKSGDEDAFTHDDEGSLPEQYSVFKEAISVRNAITALKKVTGLQARDMHDKNVMIRPQTGDIVIVDLGLFKKT